MQNPPDDWKPEGWTPTAHKSRKDPAAITRCEKTLRPGNVALWLLLFLNTSGVFRYFSRKLLYFRN